jgi:UDP-sugar transporter A1/2/3
MKKRNKLTQKQIGIMIKPTRTSSSLSKQAIFYMTLLTVQFGMQPMLTAKYTSKTLIRSTVIFIQEAIKFIFAIFMLITSGGFREALKDWSISSWIKVAAIPAGLYTAQNTAALMAYQHLDGVTFNVLNQTKTLSAALCCYLIMGRKQSKIQIVALFMLLISALIIEHIVSLDVILHIWRQGLFDVSFSSIPLSSSSLLLDSSSSNDNTKHLTHGVIPVLLASFLSGLAGAISQKNLQSSCGSGEKGGRNPYLFSAELCVASLMILFISMKFSDDGDKIQQYGFFHHWTPETLIPIVTNAIGGIVVGLVTKYAGSVRKGFALIFGMLLTGFIQSSLERNPVTNEEIVGGLLASVSLWMHATHPYSDTKVLDGSGSSNSSKTTKAKAD